MLLTSKERCTGCGACSLACRIGAITLAANPEGFYYPRIDESKCIACGACCRACPENREPVLQNGIAQYAAWNSSETTKSLSTSGGVATALSHLCWEGGWSVYGAVFDENWRLIHAKAGSPCDLDKMRGSKYCQSQTVDAYLQIRNDLTDGCKVLFFGTPCQVAGIRSVAESNGLERLYTVEFVCHGVPSPRIATDYLHLMERSHGSKISMYNFRSKRAGWGKLVVEVAYRDGSSRHYSAKLCPFHTWFGHHYSLRQSCYECKYRSALRVGDLTIADFWHIDEYYPEIPTRQGVSAVQVNNAKGSELYEKLLEHPGFESRNVSWESVWEKRPITTGPMEIPKEREAFFQAYVQGGVEELVQDFPAMSCRDLFLNKLKAPLRRVARKLRGDRNGG